MNQPLPPTINGPITPISPAVWLDGVCSKAEVFIYDTDENGVKNPKPIGHGKALTNGRMRVDLTAAPTAGHWITAHQSQKGGQDSGPSNRVFVIDAPPLATPKIASLLNTCMEGLWVDGLTPGATLVGSIAGKQVINALAWQTYQFFGIDINTAISDASILEIHQEIQPQGQLQPSPSVKSKPINSLNLEHLEPPKVTVPLQACRSNIGFAAVTPVARVHISNKGNNVFWWAPAESFLSSCGFSLQAGPLDAHQEMIRCKLSSIPKTYTVGPAQAPPPPAVQQTLCSDVNSIWVSQLIPGGLLYVARVVGGKADPARPIGITSESQRIELPLDWPLSEKGLSITLYQEDLCSAKSAPVTAEFGLRGGPYPAPKVAEPVYPCVTALRISGAHFGSYVQAFNNSTNEPISDELPAPQSDFLLHLWFPTVYPMSIIVRQKGCNANGQSNVTVKPLPQPMPKPMLPKYIRPGANSIRVEGILSGSRVWVFVDGVARAQAESFTEIATIYIPGKALVEGQKVFAYQCLCNQWSGDGPAVIVKTGNLNVTVVPPDIRPPEPVKVLANDADTGDEIIGQVYLTNQPQPVALTGESFSFASGPMSGEVKTTGYYPAHFEIGLLWNLTVHASPSWFDSSLHILISKAKWTITPDWDKSQAQSGTDTDGQPKDHSHAGNGNNRGYLYKTFSLRSPRAGQAATVNILLELSCEAVLSGVLSGGWNFLPGRKSSDACSTTITYSGSDKKVYWDITIIPNLGQDGKYEPKAHASMRI